MTNLDVLVVDDEESNVEAIRHFLDLNGVPCTYHSTVSDAAEDLTDRERHKEDPYGAIILDNHFQDHELSSRYGNDFDGIDLAIILAGKQKLFRPTHRDFIKEFFGKEYERLVRLYSDKIILFSGSVNSDSRREPEVYAGFQKVSKCPDRTDSSCEERLIRALEDLGYDFDEPMDEVRRYKGSYGLKDGKDPDFDCLSDVYERLHLKSWGRD